MTTDQATRDLAIQYAFGADDPEIDALLNRARVYGRKWNWDAAIAAIDAAYRALGAEPPEATGEDWHNGTHPLSVAIGLARRGAYLKETPNAR